MKHLGIDPGASGGFALLSYDGNVLHLVKAPDEHAVASAIFDLTREECSVTIEKVGGYIGGGKPCPVCHQPKNKSPGSSMFNFGRGVGVIIGCLSSMGMLFDEIEPQRWQAAFDLRRSKSMDKQEFKKVLQKRAQQLTTIKVSLWAADAILIARYAWLLRQGVCEGVPL